MKNKFLYLLVFNFFPVFIYAQSCDSITPSFNVDLSLSQDSVWESPLVQRNGYCCGATAPETCIEFKVKIHPSAWGVKMWIGGASGPTVYIRRECGKEYVMGSDIVAIEPIKGSSITLCKGGTTQAIYYIQSISCDSIFTLPVANFSTTTNISEIQFYNNSEYSAAHVWDFGDGTIESVYNPVHVYQDTGLYTVKLIAYNGCGSDTISQTVSISSVSTIIEEGASSYLYKLYPNPANEICVIEFTGNNKNWENMIEVYNYSGKLIKTINVASSRTYSLDTKELSSGIYFIKITNAMWVDRNKLIVR